MQIKTHLHEYNIKDKKHRNLMIFYQQKSRPQEHVNSWSYKPTLIREHSFIPSQVDFKKNKICHICSTIIIEY